MTKMDNVEVKPGLIFKDSFLVVGLEYQGPPKPMRDLWDQFCPRVPEIENRTDQAAYGYCYSSEKGEMSYMACASIVDKKSVPREMVTKHVPEGHYAVLTHRGGISKISETLEYIFGTWLPQSGYSQTERAHIELYDERFKLDENDSEFDILVPVKR